MPRSSSATRTRVIDAAYRLFYARGYARVSMDAIAEAAGVTKRTLYVHFTSKDALLGAMLEAHHALALARINRWVTSLDPHEPQSVQTLFEELVTWSCRKRWSGAGFTRIVMELADLPGHPARKIARLHKAAIERCLAEATGSARTAREIALLLEGAQALLLVHADPSYARAAAAAAEALIARSSKSDRPRKPSRCAAVAG